MKLSTIFAAGIVVLCACVVVGLVFGYSSYNDASVSVVSQHLSAADFFGASSSFSCAQAASYVELSNAGKLTVDALRVSITTAGQTSTFAAKGYCKVGHGETFLGFAVTSYALGARAGEAYTGTVALSNGAELFFSGTFA